MTCSSSRRDLPGVPVLVGLLVGMALLTFFAAWAARGDGVPLAVDLLLGAARSPCFRSWAAAPAGRPPARGARRGEPGGDPGSDRRHVVARRERLGIAVPVALAGIAGHAVAIR